MAINTSAQRFDDTFFSSVCDSLFYEKVDKDHKSFIKLDQISFSQETFLEDKPWMKDFEPIKTNIADSSISMRIIVSYAGVHNPNLNQYKNDVLKTYRISFKLVLFDGTIYAKKLKPFTEYKEYLNQIKRDISVSKETAITTGKNHVSKKFQSQDCCYLTYDSQEQRLLWVYRCSRNKGFNRTHVMRVFIDPYHGKTVKKEEYINLSPSRARKKRKPFRGFYSLTRFD